MATTTNLSMYRGEACTINFTITPVVDISGWTLAFNVGNLNTTTKSITKTGTVVSGPAGTSRVVLLTVDTSAIEPGMYYWDLWRTDSGQERPLGIGLFAIKPTVRLP